jgi:hypothetical protein
MKLLLKNESYIKVWLKAFLSSSPFYSPLFIDVFKSFLLENFVAEFVIDPRQRSKQDDHVSFSTKRNSYKKKTKIS